MTASGELAGCICCLGAGRDSQRSSDSHTFEPGGSGGASPGTLGEAKVTLTCGQGWGDGGGGGSSARVRWVGAPGFLAPPRSGVRMARARSRLAGEIMQVGSQDKTQAGVSPRAPSVPPAAASAGRRVLKLAVEGGCGGHRRDRRAGGDSSPGRGCRASPDGNGAHTAALSSAPATRAGRGSGGGEQRQVGVPVRKTWEKNRTQVHWEIPQGPSGTGSLGYQWGMAPTGSFPYLRRDGRTGRRDTCNDKQQRSCPESQHSSLGSGMLGCPQTPTWTKHRHPSRRPETGLCPSRFLLQQGTVGVQGAPWMDVLFTNRHLKVFQLTELKP